MIPDDVIAQIREAADIVAVIGQHVQLKRAGRSWKGLCPFHGEKTPSFNVMPDKGFFHCFGCQKSGDVFTFVRELEGKSFVEAAEQLGERFGIAIPKIEESPELRRARGEHVAMLEINKLATAFYRELLADPKRGAAGRAYLAKRGVNAEIIEKFQLGYAAPDWSLLADHLRASKRVDMQLVVKTGLVRPRNNGGGFWDFYRDRLVCPVIVPGGEVRGFSCRDVGSVPPRDNNDPPPKYINSPDSVVYKKDKLLFGLAQAREAMASHKRCVLVEGNFDVITLHQAGFTEVVAPLGTALTPDQVTVLRRLTERIVLLYDGDRAGYMATMKALQLCIEADVEVQVASRPGHARSGGAGPLADGVDPDSLVAGGGAETLREAVDRAQGGIEFFAFEVWSKARNNVDAMSRALKDAAALVAKVADPVKRDLIVGTLASSMQVDPAVIRNAIAQAESGRGGSRTDHGGSRSGSNGSWSGGSRDGRPGSGFHGRGDQRSNSWSGSRSDARRPGHDPRSHGPSGGPRGPSGDPRGPTHDPRDPRTNGAPRPASNSRPATSSTPPGEPRSNEARPRTAEPSRPPSAPSSDPRGPVPADPRADAADDTRFADVPPPDDGDWAPPSDDARPDFDEAPAPPERRPDAGRAHPDAHARAGRSDDDAARPQAAASAFADELELLALLTDHPSLIATADADKAFCLLTDSRLRDMYSAARDGQSLLELAGQLPAPAAKHVLSGRYTQHSNPAAQLAAMASNLAVRANAMKMAKLKQDLARSGQRNDQQIASLQARLAVAERTGDRELAARLADEIESKRKQDD